MTDLLSRANVDIAINTLLDDLQPNDAIQPSDHNGLLKDILDTLSNGLSTTLRTNPETSGQDIEITSGDKIKFKNSGFVSSLLTDTLTATRTLTFPDNSGTIALLSDITGGDNISNANLTQSDLDRTYTMPNLGKLAFGGLGSEFHLEDAIDFKMFNGSNDTASNVRFSVFVGANTSYLYFNNNRTSMTTVSDSLTLTGHATTIHTSQLKLGADIDITTSNTRSLRFRTANIFFQDITGLTNYGHIDDDEFYWGGINPIGNEKFSIQVDTLVKGSDNSASTSGFKVTDVNDVNLFDVKNNGKINMGSLPTSSAGLSSGDIWNNSGVLNIV